MSDDKVCKQGLVASVVTLSRNIEIKTDESQGCVRATIGTPDILLCLLDRASS